MDNDETSARSEPDADVQRPKDLSDLKLPPPDLEQQRAVDIFVEAAMSGVQDGSALGAAQRIAADLGETRQGVVWLAFLGDVGTAEEEIALAGHVQILVMLEDAIAKWASRDCEAEK